MLKKGIRKQINIENQSVRCCDGLEYDIRKNCIRTFYHMNFDSDFYFGTNYKNTDGYARFFTEWYPQQQEMRAFLMEFRYIIPTISSWPLTATEEKFFYDKMNAYCIQEKDRELEDWYSELQFLFSLRKTDITKEAILCCNEIYVEEDYMEITYELWFDVDSYFGTSTKNSESAWVNFYTRWYPETGEVKGYLTVYDEETVDEYFWELSSVEQEFFYRKMNVYCKKHHNGLSLRDLWRLTKEYDEIEKTDSLDEFAERIALHHIDRYNNCYWNGSGDIPKSFSTACCTYITSEKMKAITSIKIGFEQSDVHVWCHKVEFYSDNILVETVSNPSINSVKKIKETIINVLKKFL